jgi:predicted MFS family arabinose efflux permease
VDRADARASTTDGLSDARRWQFAITLVFATSGFALATWLSRVPTIRDNLEASTAQMSVLLLGLSVGSIAGLSLAPTMITRLGTRNGLFLSIGVAAVGLLLTGLTTDAWPALAAGCVALAVFGFANGSTDVLMNVEGAHAEKAVGRTCLPMMHGFFSIGTIVGAILGAVASTLGIPVVVHLSTMAALTLMVGSAAVARLPRGGATGPVEAASASARNTRWFDLRLLFVGIILAGTAFAEGAGNDWISLAAVDGHDFSNTGGAYVYGCLVAAMTLGRLAGGRLLDRFGPALVLAVLAVVGIAGVILMVLGTGTIAVVIGTLLWGVGLSLGFPACISAAADHPTDAARRVSAVSICGYATFLVGPPAIGFIGEHSGILNALWLVAVALTIALICTPAIRRATNGSATPVAESSAS